MPAMTKEQYWEQGRKAAEAGLVPAALKDGTWQASAYNRGYVNTPLDDASGPPKRHGGVMPPAGPARPPEPGSVISYSGARQQGKSILAVALSMNVHKWPPAAREHALRLIRDLDTERRPPRKLRLITALHRMNKRHGT